MKREWKTGLLAMVLLAGGGGLALADFAATIDDTPGALDWAHSAAGRSIGWRFFVDQPITITALGLYDGDHDGQVGSYTMGIWRVKKEGGLRLEQTVDLSGTGTFQADHHVYATLGQSFTIFPDPVPYTKGTTDYYERWLVGAWSQGGSTDGLILHPRDAATLLGEQAHVIRLQAYTYKQWSGSLDTTLGDIPLASNNWVPWGLTDDNPLDLHHFGVNFQYTVVPVPGAVLLGALGLSSAGWLLRRRTA